MAQTTPELINRLAERGEEALNRVAGTPGAQRVLESLGSVVNTIDDLQRRVTGVERLEQRIADLEKKVAALSKPTTTKAQTTKSSTTKSAAAKSRPKTT
jgi:uncharacterized small protein (DUF1192 family)